MGNVGRIFLDDVRLAKGSVISIIVILGMCLAPALYAWFNIAGSWNPYGNTGQLKVAVANSDEGYESDFMPVEVNIGERVVNSLHDDDAYGWVFVDEGEAIEGVRSGEYYAAVVIPRDFSEKAMTVLSADAERATVDYYLNLKENPVAPVLAGEGEASLLEGIKTRFTEAVDEMTMGLASDLVSFIDSSKSDNFGARLVSRLDTVANDLDAAVGEVRSFANIIDATSSLTSASAQALSATGDTAKSSEEYVERVSGELDNAVTAARDSASRIEQQVKAAKSDSGIDGVGGETAAQLAADVLSLSSSVKSIEENAGALAKSLDEAVGALAGTTDSLSSDLNFVRDMLGTAANRLGASASKVRKFRDDVSTAVARGDITQIAGIVGSDSDSLAQWLAAPVEVERHEVYPVENYGSSMTPFYTVLSLWIGAVILVVVMKAGVSTERVRRYQEEGGRPVRGYELYLGRFVAFAVLALLQATVLCLGNLLFLQVQCAHPLLFLAACWACAFVFCSIAYTLVLSFGGIGRALCIILLVMPVVGFGGEYPMQMMPPFFQVANSFLPFTYGMQAMRASMAGMYGAEYAVDLACLAAFLVAMLILGLALRKPVARCAGLFSDRLKKTGLM